MATSLLMRAGAASYAPGAGVSPRLSSPSPMVSIHARILIVAREDERAGPLADGLDRLGWRTVTARGVFAAMAALGDLQIEAAIVDLVGANREALSYARR